MAVGKNKLERYMEIYVGGYDLSGDARTFGSLDNGFAEVDFTGWNEPVRNFVADGYRQVGVRGFQALMNDVTGRASDRLRNADQASRLALLFGGGAAPAIGDISYHLPSVQTNAPHAMDAGRGVLTADFLPDTEQLNANFDNPLGVVLHPATSLSATTNGASVNNLASSANGCSAILHNLVAAGIWAFKVQHSINNSDWSDLITFSANGGSITSEAGFASGTINQYTRFVSTKTSGADVTPVCTLARN